MIDENRLRLHHGEPEERNDLHWRDHLVGRASEHREELVSGFTKRHGCKLLVWYEAFDDLQEARVRELQMKEWKRAWKIRLIEESNLEWLDLYPTLL